MANHLNSIYNKIYLAKLRKLRKKKKLRQSDIADLLGRSQATVSKVEAGQITLNVTELREWLGVLGVNFITFIKELDADIAKFGEGKVHMVRRKAANPTEHALHQLLHVAMTADK